MRNISFPLIKIINLIMVSCASIKWFHHTNPLTHPFSLCHCLLSSLTRKSIHIVRDFFFLVLVEIMHLRENMQCLPL